MAQAIEHEYRQHLIQVAPYFYPEIGQWSAGCVITRPGKDPSNRIACPNPAYVRSEEEAVALSLEFGQRLVDRGLVWD